MQCVDLISPCDRGVCRQKNEKDLKRGGEAGSENTYCGPLVMVTEAPVRGFSKKDEFQPK